MPPWHPPTRKLTAHRKGWAPKWGYKEKSTPKFAPGDGVSCLQYMLSLVEWSMLHACKSRRLRNGLNHVYTYLEGAEMYMKTWKKIVFSTFAKWFTVIMETCCVMDANIYILARLSVGKLLFEVMTPLAVPNQRFMFYPMWLDMFNAMLNWLDNPS